MEEVSNTQKQRTNLRITVDYDESIRCIDLENLLFGVRMICQHELAERTGVKVRDFTNTIKIEGIEKGSIVINLLMDIVQIHMDSTIDVNINLLQVDFDLVDVFFLLLYGKKTIPDKIRKYRESIMSAVSHFKSVTMENHSRRTTFRTDEYGQIQITDTNLPVNDCN